MFEICDKCGSYNLAELIIKDRRILTCMKCFGGIVEEIIYENIDRFPRTVFEEGDWNSVETTKIELPDIIQAMKEETRDLRDIKLNKK